MRTKTIVRHACTVEECKQIMNALGGSPTIASPFPNMPVEIQFHDGRTMRVRETEAIGADDECEADERHFVIRVDGVSLEE